MSKYTMRDDKFVITDGKDYIDVEIIKVIPKQQEHKNRSTVDGECLQFHDK